MRIPVFMQNGRKKKLVDITLQVKQSKLDSLMTKGNQSMSNT